MNIILTNKDREYIRSLNLHWLQVAEDGNIEMYLDNHMLQDFRACEAHFVDSIFRSRGHNKPIWFLDFGSCVHKMIEIYYLRRREPDFDLIKWAGNTSLKVWAALEMDENYSNNENYKKLGGSLGFAALLLQYAEQYHKDNERFRVVGTELYFGKDKTVLLGSTPFFRLYLSGKIDLLVDDGEAIVPMDHKTTKHFMGRNPLLSYEIQEGMTGYVLAAKELLLHYNLNNVTNSYSRKLTNKIWMNFLQVTPEKDPKDRFKRLPLFKTAVQLEDYKLRQVRTATNILQLILTMPDGVVPSYNTMMCNNWMHQQCGFFEVHRLESTNHDLILLRNYQEKPVWNPEVPHEKDIELDKII